MCVCVCIHLMNTYGMPAIFQHYGRQFGDMMDYKAHTGSLMGKVNTRTSIYSKMFLNPRILKVQSNHKDHLFQTPYGIRDRKGF